MREIDPQNITEPDLHAYVDGQLSPDASAMMAEWLDCHPREAAMVHEWQAQAEAIRYLYGAEISAEEEDEAISDEMRVRKAALSQKMHAESLSPRRAFASLAPIAASLAIFFLGGISGGLLVYREQARSVSQEGPRIETIAQAEQDLIENAKVNHLIYTAEHRHKVEVGADEKEHLGKWLGNRLNSKSHMLPIPDLTSEGFDLVGGRLVPYRGKPSALLVYGAEDGKQLTILIGRMASGQGEEDKGRQFAKEGDLGILAWQQGGLGYAVSAPLDQNHLQDLADRIAS